MSIFHRFGAAFHTKPRARHVARSLALASVILLTLTSCEMAKNQLTYDRAGELERQDYRDALAPAPFPDDSAAAVPEFAPVVATPEELRLPSPLVTVSVNNTVALRDLLFELAEQADVDLELDPQIRGSIIFTAKDRPFDEVIARISDMAGLRYTFEKNVLRIEMDRPFVRNYDLDYVNITRTGASSMNTSVQLGGSGGGTTGGPTTSGGSSSSIDGRYDADVWQELETNIEQILTSSDTYTSLATMSDPIVTPVSTLAPPPMPSDPNDPSTVPPILPGSPQVSQMAPAVPPTLQVSASPVGEPLVPNPPATFSISRQSGMLSVFASERQHRAVKKFIDEFRRRLTTQILIEAKVLQVELSDEYATGIEWDEIKLFDDINISANFPTAGLNPAAQGGFSVVMDNGDISTIIQAVSRFGTVRALSSPRITVMNNQPALINVAQNNVYFSFDVETEDDSDTNETRITIDSEQRSAPEGVIMSVVPAANPSSGEILLSVRPTISRITNTIVDPTIAFSLISLGVDPSGEGIPQNNIPQISVQEIDSMLKLQSGQVVVMGGLMRDSNSVTDESMPVLGDLPLIGNLFKSHSDIVEKAELVILIRARIVEGATVDDMDRKLFRTFSNDRRPAPM
jgi:general secretion pathway protein D